MKEMYLEYAPYLLAFFAWKGAKFVYQPPEQYQERLNKLDTLERELMESSEAFKQEKEWLIQQGLASEQALSTALKNVERYKRIAEKANKERHGAVQRFRRKLKKYEESGDERNIL